MNLSVHEKTIQRTLSSGFALLNLGNVSTAVTTSFTDSSAKIQYDNIAKNCVALANGGTLAGIKSASMPSSGLPTSILMVLVCILFFHASNNNDNSNNIRNALEKKLKFDTVSCIIYSNIVGYSSQI